MKKINGKNKTNMPKTQPPRYRLVIPFIICIYMIISMLVPGMDNKSVFLVMMSACLIVWFVGEKIFPDKVYIEELSFHNKYVYIFAGIFVSMTLVSGLFAKDYSDSSLVGEDDSILVLLAYVVLFYMTYRYFYIEESQKIFRYTVICIGGLLIATSLIEFLDISIAVLWLEDEEKLTNMNRVVLSFGNSNYYGGFCCMLLPFIMEMWIYAQKKAQKIMLLMLNAGIVCCVMLSKSTLAVYLMVLIVMAVCMYELKYIIKQWMYGLGLVVTVVLMTLTLNIMSEGKMMELVGISVGNQDAFTEDEYDIYEIKDIQLCGNRVIIKGTDTSFVMEYAENFTFYDEDGNILDIDNKDGIVKFTEEPYDAISVGVYYNENINALYVEIDAGYKDTIDFYISSGKFKGVGADGNPVDDIGGQYEESRLDSMFTGRGYVWRNTLSMLDDVIFIGKGNGNFVHNFKQYDYVGLLKSQGTHHVIVDRPHNMILQYCIDIGVLGTTALVALVIYILMGRLKRIRTSERDNAPLSFASIVAVVAFLIFSLLNDSLVVVSPYMWIFLGLNMALQYAGKLNEKIQ